MKIIIKNAVCTDYETGESQVMNVAVEGKKVTYAGTGMPDGISEADRAIDAGGYILIPGFVNAHCHAPMTLLRGLGCDKPLDVWLESYIYPAEERLNPELAYIGSLAAAAEMIRGGVVSFSDMYFFCDKVADAVIDSGMKANVSRSIVSFDETVDPSNDPRIAEGLALFREYNNAGDGRIKVDFSIHAEYTNTESTCRYVAELAGKCGTGIQLHLSETEKEHREGIARRGMTPAAFFEKCGVFDVPVTAAHCVWLEDGDIDIMQRHGAAAVHNPRSNLKLGSGIMPYEKLAAVGVNIALGTDGSASNNKLDLMSEMQLAAILHKGAMRNAEAVPAGAVLRAASAGGAASQGREAYSRITEGMPADLALISCGRIGLSEGEDPAGTLVYSADRSDVSMTMVDGRILYENGEYMTIDEERLSYDFEAARKKLIR